MKNITLAIDDDTLSGARSCAARHATTVNAIVRDHLNPLLQQALLAAAERLGVPVFYSEDLPHGQTYGSVRVINPFLED